MITPLNRSSLEDTLADFDRVFGLEASGSKNPMAYRRKGDGDKICPDRIGEAKKSEEIILLPQGIKTDDVLKRLGRSLGERYLLIISSLYCRGLLRKKVMKKKGNFLAGHWEIFRKLGGEKYSELIRVGISDFQHIKKSPKAYIPGKQAGEYALDTSTLDLSRQYRYTLKTVWASNARRQYRQARRFEFAAKHAVYAKIAASVDGLMFDYAAATKYVAGIKDDGRRLHRQAVLESLRVGEILWAIDKQGRNYTVLVSVPRDIRVFFSWHGQPLWVVDVGSSQPLLHAILYPDGADEKSKYLAALRGGFWAFMRDAAVVAVDLEDEEAKGEMKEQIFRQVFYSYHEGKKGPKGIYAKAFRREFPVLWAEITKRKKAYGPKQSAGLSKEMMRTEAWAVFEAISTLRHRHYPLISIHDAIATTAEGVGDVVAALASAFLPLGLEPRLAAKRMTLISRSHISTDRLGD
jgi:hypothetical protein